MPTLQIQRFTYDLCHVYARCTKVASRPSPIYYAHLAAFHAPWYSAGFHEKGDAWETSSTSSKGSSGSGASKASTHAPVVAQQRRARFRGSEPMSLY